MTTAVATQEQKPPTLAQLIEQMKPEIGRALPRSEELMTPEDRKAMQELRARQDELNHLANYQSMVLSSLQRGLIGAVSRAALQHEALVAVAAIDIAMLVDFQPDARMAQRGATPDIGGAIAGNASGGDGDGFGRLDHDRAP